jgi:hypothetical protein
MLHTGFYVIALGVGSRFQARSQNCHERQFVSSSLSVLPSLRPSARIEKLRSPRMILVTFNI